MIICLSLLTCTQLKVEYIVSLFNVLLHHDLDFCKYFLIIGKDTRISLALIRKYENLVLEPHSLTDFENWICAKLNQYFRC